MQLSSLLLMATWQIKGLQLFASLSLLIVLHEFGHYFFAKLFKTRVEKFYLFFDFLFPFSTILPFSLFKKKVGETEYGVGWFPLGGYVKIAGMVDESMDKEALAKPPQPWEFRSKKAYQRLLIMLGGIILNVLAAWLIYSFVFAKYGEVYLPAANLKYGIATNEIGKKIGLENGDKIVAVGGQKIERFEKAAQQIIFSNNRTIEIEREGKLIKLAIPDGTVASVLKAQKADLVRPRYPFVVDTTFKTFKAYSQGVAKGDSLIAINNHAATFVDEYINARQSNIGRPVTFTFMRSNGEVYQATDTPNALTIFGVAHKSPASFLTSDTIQYNFITALPRGIAYTGEQFAFYWQQFKMLFTHKEVKLNESLGGIGSFAKIFPESFSWQSFLMLTAFISIILAFMNLLPIPGLDGGYVFFLLIEMITGKKVSDSVMEKATTVGLVLLLALMLYANGLDIFRALR